MRVQLVDSNGHNFLIEKSKMAYCAVGHSSQTLPCIGPLLCIIQQYCCVRHMQANMIVVAPRLCSLHHQL